MTVFSEAAAAVRLRDDCNCWMISFKVSRNLADDGTDFSFGFELSGLGDIGADQYDNVVSDLK